MSNLEFWNKYGDPDPDRVKPFKRTGGFEGKSVNATYIAQQLTDAFGPIGKGWGVNITDEKYVDGAPIIVNDKVVCNEIVHIVQVELWYIKDDKECYVRQFGQTMFVTKNKWGIQTDEEAPKKSLTDGMLKCAALLGFGANIHLGLWDDNKYVNDVKQRRGEKEEKPKVVPQNESHDLQECRKMFKEWADAGVLEQKGADVKALTDKLNDPELKIARACYAELKGKK